MSAKRNLTGVALVGIGLLIVGKNWNKEKPTKNEIEETRGGASYPYVAAGVALSVYGLYLLLSQSNKK
jgi:hypothetical protein